MPVRPVVAIPNPVLKRRAAPAGRPDEELAADLLDTMRVSPGCVGLAAPQIGVSRRVFCLDVSGHPKGKPNHGLVVLFDPELLHVDGSELRREGCMSVPDFTADVRRALRVVVRGTDPDGRERVYEAEGFEARAFQHELDHLDGMIILDRVASLTTDVFRRKTYQPRRD
ncbi:MAG TPA: peptide deformylase [Egibacteraceae bacterium]|jgi:peptide deformylase|nr:peptide deformylase [Egibacteraceae bacterium]